MNKNLWTATIDAEDRVASNTNTGIILLSYQSSISFPCTPTYLFWQFHTCIWTFIPSALSYLPLPITSRSSPSYFFCLMFCDPLSSIRTICMTVGVGGLVDGAKEISVAIPLKKWFPFTSAHVLLLKKKCYSNQVRQETKRKRQWGTANRLVQVTQRREPETVH